MEGNKRIEIFLNNANKYNKALEKQIQFSEILKIDLRKTLEVTFK